MSDKESIVCSFCGKHKNEVKKLVAGANVYICNNCIELCSEIVRSDTETRHDTNIKLMTPMEIHSKLDEYVIGQSYAKKVLSVAVHNHYKRVLYGSSSDVELEKSNILLFGPTGTGKTLLARTLARILNVPFAIADATSLTEAGYVGEDVENVLLKIYHNANEDIARAQMGIIFIDEIDKISRKNDSPSITRDVSGEGVQQSLLKIIEGTVANVPPQGGRKHPQQEYLNIDTTNILFICGGAFSGIEDVIQRRTGRKALGFYNDPEPTGTNENKSGYDLLKLAEPDDFVKYGLIPEFVGRLPVCAPLEDLDEQALIKIMIEPKNALTKQYEAMLKFDNVELKFTDEALLAIAKLAIKRKTGARGLRAIMEEAMTEVMYKIPSRKDVRECIINEDVINNCAEPMLVLDDEKGIAQ